MCESVLSVTKSLTLLDLLVWRCGMALSAGGLKWTLLLFDVTTRIDASTLPNAEEY